METDKSDKSETDKSVQFKSKRNSLIQIPVPDTQLTFGMRLSPCPSALSTIISNRLPFKVSPKRH